MDHLSDYSYRIYLLEFYKRYILCHVPQNQMSWYCIIKNAKYVDWNGIKRCNQQNEQAGKKAKLCSHEKSVQKRGYV